MSAAPATQAKPEEEAPRYPSKMPIAKTITFDKIVLKELTLDASSLTADDYFKIVDEVAKEHFSEMVVFNKKSGSDHFVMEALSKINKIPAIEIRNNLSLSELEYAIEATRFFLRRR